MISPCFVVLFVIVSSVDVAFAPPGAGVITGLITMWYSGYFCGGLQASLPPPPASRSCSRPRNDVFAPRPHSCDTPKVASGVKRSAYVLPLFVQLSRIWE